MSMGICDSCLEPAFHARMQDGRRILLDPASHEVRFLLDLGDEIRVVSLDPADPRPENVTLARQTFAFQAHTYKLHECPEKAGAGAPSSGKTVDA